MNYFSRKSKKEWILIGLITLFYLSAIWLSSQAINVTMLAIPVSFILGFWIWKTQELKKRRADCGEEMFKAFHTYAIKVVRLDYYSLPKIKKRGKLTDRDIEFLEEKTYELVEFRAQYIIKMLAFYRVVDVAKEKQIELESAFSYFNQIVKDLEEFLSLNDPSLDDVNKIGSQNSVNVNYADKAREILESIVKPFIRLD